jgi:CheY-like chemotaxis protein
LILEDNFLIAASLARIVGEAGFTVVGPASSVQQGHEWMNEKGIDAALLDINLGGDDRCFEFATQLLALHVPFGFVTGSSLALLPPALRQAPSVIKPFSDADVRRLLDRLLPAPGSHS